MIRIRYSIKHNKAYLLIKRLKCWKQIEYIFMQDALKDRMGTIFSQSKGYINKDWVLLDSQSPIDLFCNASLLTNIRVVNDHLNIFCNAGSASTNIVGDLKGYGTVWFYDSGIANILSLHRAAERFHVTYDIQESNCFIV